MITQLYAQAIFFYLVMFHYSFVLLVIFLTELLSDL